MKESQEKGGKKANRREKETVKERQHEKRDFTKRETDPEMANSEASSICLPA